MKLASVTAAGALLAAALSPVAAAHGDAVPPSRLVDSWSVDLLPLITAVVFLALFARGFVRLRRRGRRDRAPWWRAVAAAASAGIALLSLFSPLDTVGEEYLISGHMLQHVLLADVAPALAVVAVQGPLFYLLLPPLVLHPLVRVGPLRAVVAFIARAPVSFAIWAISLAVWHIPAIYDAALTRKTVHDVEHFSFVLGGLLIWLQLLGIPARRPPLLRLGFLVAVYAFGEFLAYALILSFSPYYPAYATQDERLFGIGPLLDQKLAGVVMMAEQTIVLGLLAFFLIREHLDERKALEARARRRAERLSATRGGRVRRRRWPVHLSPDKLLWIICLLLGVLFVLRELL